MDAEQRAISKSLNIAERSGAKSGTSVQQQAGPSFSMKIEALFIALVREAGGMQTLRKLEKELLRLKQIIDKELK